MQTFVFFFDCYRRQTLPVKATCILIDDLGERNASSSACPPCIETTAVRDYFLYNCSGVQIYSAFRLRSPILRLKLPGNIHFTIIDLQEIRPSVVLYFEVYPVWQEDSHEMIFCTLSLLPILVCVSSISQSHVAMSSSGYEFQPRSLVQLLQQTSVATRLRCSSACNQHFPCRAFDFDSVSSRCRLFEGDLTTGSITASASTTSSVGIVTVSTAMFSQTHNKSCPACQDSRYETCSPIKNRCQCGPRMFWNGSMCSLQRFTNDSCSQLDACRIDLNLVCMKSFAGSFTTCLPGTRMN